MEKASHNKTKIVATVGPASSSKEMLRALVQEGVDVFRLNFSHGTHDDHQKVINFVRELNEEMGTRIALLQDLQGPKVRVGQLPGGEIKLHPGEIVSLVPEEEFHKPPKKKGASSSVYKSSSRSRRNRQLTKVV